MTQQESPPKCEVIRQTLADGILSGQHPPGHRLPSESQLVKAVGASRPTVNRALRELQLAGLIERRAGSGSYVRADAAARGYTFGLLIPELGGTEIFEPICRGMAEAQHGSQHVLLWGSSFAVLAPLAIGAISDAMGKPIYGFMLATGFAALLFVGMLLNQFFDPTSAVLGRADETEYQRLASNISST